MAETETTFKYLVRDGARIYTQTEPDADGNSPATLIAECPDEQRAKWVLFALQAFHKKEVIVIGADGKRVDAAHA